MKSRLYSLVALILVVFIGKAQEKTDLEEKHYFKNASIKTSFNKEVIEYKFTSLDDLREQIEQIVKELTFNDAENKKDGCEVFIELKLEIGIGATKVLLSETITTNCESNTAIMAVEKFKAMITAAIG